MIKLSAGKSLLLPSMLCMAASWSLAAEPHGDSLSIELARHFTGGGEFYQDLPEGFPAFDAPEGLQVLGSLRQSLSQRVVLSSDSLSPRAALGSVAAALAVEHEWQAQPPVQQGQRGGQSFFFRFQQAGMDASQGWIQLLCQEQGGQLQLQAWPREQGSVVLLSRSASSGQVVGDNCERQQAALERQSARVERWRAGPSLRLPPELEQGVRFLRPEIQNNTLWSRAQVGVEMEDLDVLANSLGEQLTAQGWAIQSQWQGEFSSGSLWQKPGEAEDQWLLGRLTLLRLQEGGLEIGFHLQVPDALFAPFNVMGSGAAQP